MGDLPALHVLIIGPVANIPWLKTRLSHLEPPPRIRQLESVEEESGADNREGYDLILALPPDSESAVLRWPAALICEPRLSEEETVRLIAYRPQHQALVCVIERQLNAAPNAAANRLAERMRLVNEVSLEIAAIHDLDAILSIIPDRLTEIVGFYHASVGVIGSDGIEMYEASQRSRAVGPERFRIPLDGRGMVPWVARAGVARLSNDTRRDEIWIPGKGLEASRSELTVPLVYRERIIGTIDVQSEHVNAFNDDDVSVLEALAGQLAVAIENARLFNENKHQRLIAETLSRISRLAGSLLNVYEVSQTALDELRNLLTFDAALLALFENNAFRVVYQTGFSDHDTASLHWLVDESPIFYRIFNHREIMLVADTAAERLWRKARLSHRIRSWLGVPVLSHGRPIGVLGIAGFEPGAFQARDSEVLLAFANQIAGTIDNAQLFERSDQREREARTLYEITRLLVSFDQSAIPTSIMNHLGEAIPFDVAGMLVRGSPNRIVLATKRPVAEGVVQDVERHLLNTYTALSGTVINGQGLQRQVKLNGPLPEDPVIERLDARLSVPLLAGRNVVGVIEVARADPTLYGDAEIRTLYIIANSTATALENARLYQELMDRARNLQQVIDELAEADQLKDELVGNISHELRAPLTYIVGYVDLLLAGEMGELSSDQRESLDIVAAKARTLTRLVADILSFEKLTALDLAMAEVDIGALVEQTVHDFRMSAAEAQIEVEAAIQPDMTLVMADADRMGQVLNNLLGNALKFSPEGSTITVRVMQHERQVRIEVEDRGVGIAADKLSRIFDRFYQVNDSHYARRGGVGLGLTISKQIVEAHGGEIGVTSEEGVGSTFFVVLPGAIS